VDDDGNGLTDEVGETAYAGDDGDDNGGRLYWSHVMRLNLVHTSLIWANTDPGSGGGNLFAIRDMINLVERALEATNEINPGFYQPNTLYSYAFCASGSCYGAILWTGADMANPNEIQGPLVNTGHELRDPDTGLDRTVAYLNEQSNTDLSDVGNCYLRQAQWGGNLNFSRKFWAIGDGGGLPFGEPISSADLDDDGDVDGNDFLTFSLCFNDSLNPPQAACPKIKADLDGDGDVDGNDFLTFSLCFNNSLRPPQAACRPYNLTACP
jgi:hypothetical protein